MAAPPRSATARPLTPLQEAFCREYVIDLNGSAAYARACAAVGKVVAKSAGVAASKLLTQGKISARITELSKQSAERVAAQIASEEHAAETESLTDYVIRRLRENAERAMQSEPVTDKDGTPIGIYTWEGSVANQALKLLGDTQGMFKQVIETRDRSLEDALKGIAHE